MFNVTYEIITPDSAENGALDDIDSLTDATKRRIARLVGAT